MKIKGCLCFFVLLGSLNAWANLPYQAIALSRDDAAHYANVPYPVHNMTEWWYYNGKLVAHNGKKFGYYFVIFRTQFHFLWKKIIIGLAQYQITDVSEHKVVAYGSVPFSEKNSQF